MQDHPQHHRPPLHQAMARISLCAQVLQGDRAIVLRRAQVSWKRAVSGCVKTPQLTDSCLYYWGVVGLLIGLTLYRPAYSATALTGTLLDNPAWIGFWSVFALVSATAGRTHRFELTYRAPSFSTCSPTCTSPRSRSRPVSRASSPPVSGSAPSSAPTTGSRRLVFWLWCL